MLLKKLTETVVEKTTTPKHTTDDLGIKVFFRGSMPLYPARIFFHSEVHQSLDSYVKLSHPWALILSCYQEKCRLNWVGFILLHLHSDQCYYSVFRFVNILSEFELFRFHFIKNL